MKSELQKGDGQDKRGQPHRTGWVRARLWDALAKGGNGDPQVWFDKLLSDATSVRDRIAICFILQKLEPRNDRLQIDTNVTVQSLAVALTGSADGGATRFVEAVVRDTLETGATARGFVPAETILKRLGSVSEPEHLIDNPQGVTEQVEAGSEPK